MRQLHHIKAIIFDFDGTLAVLNIDFSYHEGKDIRFDEALWCCEKN